MAQQEIQPTYSFTDRGNGMFSVFVFMAGECQELGFARQASCNTFLALNNQKNCIGLANTLTGVGELLSGNKYRYFRPNEQQAEVVGHVA